MTGTIIPCTLRSLPAPVRVEAARTAVRINPANCPPPGVTDPARIALETSKYWGKGGVSLTVQFLEQATAAFSAKILAHMNLWGKTANVRFTLVSSGGQVRISRGQGGYWSYLGTDILHIGAGEPTMNLEGFSESTSDSEYLRVVCHETGHTLGCPHEHLRRDLVRRLDPQRTIEYFGRTQGWSQSQVQQQVLTPLDEASLMSTPVDQDSIMCYQLPASITTDGQPIPGGTQINPSDADFMGRVYPGGGTIDPTKPPPPGPPVKPPPGPDVPVTISVPGSASGRMAGGGQVDLYAFTFPADGTCEITTTGEAQVHVDLTDTAGQPTKPDDPGDDSVSPGYGVFMLRLLDKGDYRLEVTASRFDPLAGGAYVVSIRRK